MIDYSDIDRVLDETLQAAWQALADNESMTAWAYGDLLNRTYISVKANALEFTKQDVAVWSVIVTGTDRSPRTILYYAEVSQFYSPEIREAYDPLPFTHFRYAMTRGEGWRDVLEYSLEYAGRYGKPPSRKKLRREFEGVDEDSEKLGKALESLHAQGDNGNFVNLLPDMPGMPDRVYDEQTPQDVYEEARRLLSRLNMLLPRLSNGRGADKISVMISQVLALISAIVSVDM